MNFRALEKSIWVLEKSWKFVSEKGYEPCIEKIETENAANILMASRVWLAVYILKKQFLHALYKFADQNLPGSGGFDLTIGTF